MADCQGGRLAEKQADKEQGKPQLSQRERDVDSGAQNTERKEEK